MTRQDIFQVKNFIVWFKTPFSIIVFARLKIPPLPIENHGWVFVATDTYIR